MSAAKLKLLPLETFLSAVQASVGTAIFTRLYARVNGRKVDLLREGDLACATFVTGIMSAHNLIGSMHATVSGALDDMERSGWKRISRPKKGAVLVWEEAKQARGETHRHIGVYVSVGKAISNSSKTGKVSQHHWTYGRSGRKPKRAIESVWWHPSFG